MLQGALQSAPSRIATLQWHSPLKASCMDTAPGLCGTAARSCTESAARSEQAAFEGILNVVIYKRQCEAALRFTSYATRRINISFQPFAARTIMLNELSEDKRCWDQHQIRTSKTRRFESSSTVRHQELLLGQHCTCYGQQVEHWPKGGMQNADTIQSH